MATDENLVAFMAHLVSVSVREPRTIFLLSSLDSYCVEHWIRQEDRLPTALPVLPAENAGKQKRSDGKGQENWRPAIVEGYYP